MVIRHQYAKYGTVHQIRDSTPNAEQYTKYGTVHQMRDNTPNTGQYTKYRTVHQIRDITLNESSTSREIDVLQPACWWKHLICQTLITSSRKFHEWNQVFDIRLKRYND